MEVVNENSLGDLKLKAHSATEQSPSTDNVKCNGDVNGEEEEMESGDSPCNGDSGAPQDEEPMDCSENGVDAPVEEEEPPQPTVPDHLTQPDLPQDDDHVSPGEVEDEEELEEEEEDVVSGGDGEEASVVQAEDSSTPQVEQSSPAERPDSAQDVSDQEDDDSTDPAPTDPTPHLPETTIQRLQHKEEVEEKEGEGEGEDGTIDLVTPVKDQDATDPRLDSTPEKGSNKKKKSQPISNVTPRRSSRNLNKTRSYVDESEVKSEDDDVQEVPEQKPVILQPATIMKKNTIVVNDTKRLAEIAAGSKAAAAKGGKKEPTLVIIDTNSLLANKAVSLTPSLPSRVSVVPVSSAQNLFSSKPVKVPAAVSITPPPSSLSKQQILTTRREIPAASQPPREPQVILPSLTDDMFVVEAPSFIVPYVYEKPPVNALKEYLKDLQKKVKVEEDEKRRKEEEEEKEREEEEKKRKELLGGDPSDDQLKVKEEESMEVDKDEVEEKKDIEKMDEEKKDEEKKDVEKMDEEKDEVKKDEEKKDEEKKDEEKKDEEKKDEEKKNEEKKNEEKVDEEKMEVDDKVEVKKEEVKEEGDKDLDKEEETDEEKEKDKLEEKPSEDLDKDKDKEKDKDKDKDKEKEKEKEKEKKEEATVEKTGEKKTSSDVEVLEDKTNKTKSDNYFENPLGKFFMQIGINLVQEHVQTDLLKNQMRKKDKEGSKCSADVHMAISALTKTLEVSKENNKPFRFDLKKCQLCNFRTESQLVMAHHLETPHMKNFVYRCNFCELEVRSPHDILFHMEAEHNVRGRLDRSPAFHQCPNCPFEDNQKGKLSRHLLSCAKKYKPERNQEPPLEWEPPAKIPRVRGARGLPLYPTPSAASLSNPARLSCWVSTPPSRPATSQAALAAQRGRGRPPIYVQRYPQTAPSAQKLAAHIRQGKLPGGVVFRPSNQPPVLLPTAPYSLTPSLIQQAKSVSNGATAKILQQPSISITPLPRSSSTAAVQSPAASLQPKPGRPPTAATPSKNSFVICEICDGYIKDLEQLRNHMQWIHKVKIHPKMIYNRPPLNCQKCQFRFFTDQGLERHLLGSHGLVTSSMQEAANKGKDGGRCPVCGRVYQWKLLNHVARDHSMSLKPAHLSYKCTVCTATFGMYKQFENHVYSAHSVVAKRVIDKTKPGTPSTPAQQPSTSNNTSESMLKPLKINDEITIIPQPARAKGVKPSGAATVTPTPVSSKPPSK